MGQGATQVELARWYADRHREEEGQALEVPVVHNLDRRILRQIDRGCGLEMVRWHTCRTTHCLAGWAIALAGQPGHDLELAIGPEHAGALIWEASTGECPCFFDDNDPALNGLARRAAYHEPARPWPGSPPRDTALP